MVGRSTTLVPTETIEWTAMKFGKHIHIPVRMKQNNLIDTLTFHLASSIIW